MNIAEIKQDIIKQFAIKIAAINDEQVLKKILDFVEGIETGDKHGVNLSRHYDAIKLEYNGVLKKLAE